MGATYKDAPALMKRDERRRQVAELMKTKTAEEMAVQFNVTKTTIQADLLAISKRNGTHPSFHKPIKSGRATWHKGIDQRTPVDKFHYDSF